MNIVQEKLNPVKQAFSVLGHIANNPNELLGTTVNISDDDFVLDFHKILFRAINNIAVDGEGKLDEVTPLAVDVFLSSYPKYYRVWQSNDGAQFLEDAKNNESQFSFKHEYELIKKYSVLRKYYHDGIDIKDTFDYEETDIQIVNEQIKKLETMTVSDIVEYYTTKILNIRNDIEVENEDRITFAASDDIDTLLIRLNSEPVMGYPFINGYYNTLFRGMQGGRFMLRSGKSGAGKTRTAIKDIAHASMTEMYDKNNKRWIDIGLSVPSLFISTELNKDELQTILLAFVSGMTTSEIESGEFNDEQKQRLEHAVSVIKKSNMSFVYIEDFSAMDIQMTIEEYIIKEDVKFVVFDYIQNSPKLSKSFQESYGKNGIREDEILVELSRSLKNMAEKYDVFILSSTQLNSLADDDNIGVSRTGRALRGGASTINKADYGIIMAKPTAMDIKKLSALQKEQNGFQGIPTFGHFIFKNRSGMSDIIIWTDYNPGNMREKPLFITDFNYNLITHIPETEGNLGKESKVENDVFDF